MTRYTRYMPEFLFLLSLALSFIWRPAIIWALLYVSVELIRSFPLGQLPTKILSYTVSNRHDRQ
jgi:hypothetical protein